MSENRDQHNLTIARVAQLTGQLIWLGHKRVAQQLASYGITAPQYFTLASLVHQDRPRSMHILAEISHQDAATVTGIVDRLVRLGYVSRQRGEKDRRKVYVTLEQAGRDVVEEIRLAIQQNWQRSFSALSQADLDEMLRMLEAIYGAWQSETHPVEPRT